MKKLMIFEMLNRLTRKNLLKRNLFRIAGINHKYKTFEKIFRHWKKFIQNTKIYKIKFRKIENLIKRSFLDNWTKKYDSQKYNDRVIAYFQKNMIRNILKQWKRYMIQKYLLKKIGKYIQMNDEALIKANFLRVWKKANEINTYKLNLINMFR